MSWVNALLSDILVPLLQRAVELGATYVLPYVQVGARLIERRVLAAILAFLAGLLTTLGGLYTLKQLWLGFLGLLKWLWDYARMHVTFFYALAKVLVVLAIAAALGYGVFFDRILARTDWLDAIADTLHTPAWLHRFFLPLPPPSKEEEEEEESMASGEQCENESADSPETPEPAPAPVPVPVPTPIPSPSTRPQKRTKPF